MVVSSFIFWASAVPWLLGSFIMIFYCNIPYRLIVCSFILESGLEESSLSFDDPLSVPKFPVEICYLYSVFSRGVGFEYYIDGAKSICAP